MLYDVGPAVVARKAHQFLARAAREGAEIVPRAIPLRRTVAFPVAVAILRASPIADADLLGVFHE